MDLRRLRYFCAIVENGSITKAAKALHIAQPPLSKRLQELEEEIGVSLLTRESRQIKPTAAGYYLYQRTADILRQLDTAVNETIAVAQQKHKLIRVGLTHLFQRHFSKLIMELHEANPTLEISVSVSDSGHLEYMLVEGGMIDIALIQKPLDNTGFDCMDFAPVKLVAVASASVGGFESGTVSLHELADVPLIMLRRSGGIGTYEKLRDHFRRIGTEPNVIMSISQPEAILNWLQSGLDAVALLPESEVTNDALGTCRVITISHAPLIFFPAAVKLTTSVFPPELAAAVDKADLFV